MKPITKTTINHLYLTSLAQTERWGNLDSMRSRLEYWRENAVVIAEILKKDLEEEGKDRSDDISALDDFVKRNNKPSVCIPLELYGKEKWTTQDFKINTIFWISERNVFLELLECFSRGAKIAIEDVLSFLNAVDVLCKTYNLLLATLAVSEDSDDA